ncbi:MAG: cytochrome ubiquinol oxidase subunit I [Candidatus Sulfobium sp.]|jgi:cytochrome d ubiquinol oxidase subunit I
MDAVILSRLQFAVTTMFHFIFVPITLGLSLLVAWMETRYVRTGNEMYLRMTKFWGKLFLINFAIGIVTGITLEFQFGMNWAEYSKYVGDIFGAPLAIEATVAFFLESTFIGFWIFGWNRVSKKVHALSIWLVAIASNLSALWILLANGWMQHPVGYVLRNNRAEMADFLAVATNPYGLLKFFHTIFAAYVVASFFVIGVSAYHILKNKNLALFKSSFRMAATFGLVSSIMVFVVGDFHAAEVAKTQPTKFAAMESLWDTTKGAPYYLIEFPDPGHERNLVQQIEIPKMLSYLAFGSGDAEIAGLKAFAPADRPPVIATFLSFRTMLALGLLFVLLTLIAFVIALRDRTQDNPFFLRLMICAIPLPFLATQVGWIVAEVGRQPWIVYGVLRTSDAASKSVTASQVLGSLIGFVLLYGLLAVTDIYLLAHYARKGPEEDLSSILKTSTGGEA